MRNIILLPSHSCKKKEGGGETEGERTEGVKVVLKTGEKRGEREEEEDSDGEVVKDGER